MSGLLVLLAVWAAAGDSPYVLMKSLTESGQRWAGAPGRAKALARLERLMRDRGLEVSREAFIGVDPADGRRHEMANLIGRFRPGAPCRVLLGSHFDTRHVAEQDPDPKKRSRPIPGANDGTSGVAVLLALAERFERVVPAGLGVDVVLFDGEEMGYPSTGGYCLGSKDYARRLRASPSQARPRFGIILDMVCAPEAAFKVEELSRAAAPAVVDSLWTLGAARGLPFSRQGWGKIYDDHAALSEAGVPSALIIGFNDPRWHTSADGVARCSAKRLDQMAGLLEEFLRAKAAGLSGCRR